MSWASLVCLGQVLASLVCWASALKCFFSLHNQRFKDVCRALTSVRWTHEETRDGITLSRSKFGGSRNGRIVMRVEGILPADPNTVYQFLQLSTKEGGKVCVCECILCLYTCLCACVSVSCVCTCVCVRVSVFCVCVRVCECILCLYMCLCACVCMYVCVCVYMCDI